MKIWLLLLTLLLTTPAISETVPVQDVEIEFSFTDNSVTGQEDGFRVYRCGGRCCIPTVRILTLLRNATTFTDWSMLLDTEHRLTSFPWGTQ